MMLRFMTLWLWSSALCVAASPEWQQYQSDFVQADGRVIDVQKGITHSEAQGYAMLLSLNFADRALFASLWRWTQDNLQQRSDHLMAWSWGQRADQSWGILDANNATDGDILIAFALLKASRLWNQTGYQRQALEIIQDIRTRLCYSLKGRIFLLPGEQGFIDDQEIKLNPSYQILAAFELFAEFDRPDFWLRVKRDAVWLVEQSIEPQSGLPADWLWLSKVTGLPSRRDERYGYEAVRVFLYQLWEPGRDLRLPLAMFDRARRGQTLFSQYQFDQPDKIYRFSALSGILYLYSLLALKSGDKGLAQVLFQQAFDKQKQEKRQYYASSLFLLAGVEL